MDAECYMRDAGMRESITISVCPDFFAILSSFFLTLALNPSIRSPETLRLKH